MTQALHIFQKDVAYLKYQITLVLAATILFAGYEIRGLRLPISPGVTEILIIVTATFLIAMLIHAEAIPGDRQYWLTRPFSWRSLIAAKLLFIAVFVNLPVFLAQLAIIIAANFPLAASLPGLLWSQVLLSVCLWLPIGALAAVTARIPMFLFSVLVLMAVELGVTVLMQRSGQSWPEGVDWVRSALLAFGAITITAVVLYAQYKHRRTLFSRAFALSAAALFSAAYLAMPWPLAFAVQSRFSRPVGSGNLEFSLASARINMPSGLKNAQVQVGLPISVRGLPDGVDLQANALALAIEAPDSRTLNVPLRPLSDLVQHAAGQPALLNENVFVDRTFFNQERDRPVTLHLSLYVTLFGNERSRTIPLQSEPANVMDGLQCSTFTASLGWDVYCRSLFRWPDEAVYAQVGGIQTNAFTRLISFSPFPANLSLSPVEMRWAPVYPSGATPKADDVTIIMKKPLAHFRRDVEVRGVRLAELAIPWYSRVLVQDGRVYRLERQF